MGNGQGDSNVLFQNASKEGRLMYYPAAASYLFELLDESTNKRGQNGLSKQAYESIDLQRGTTYITVPLEWPEKDLEHELSVAQFFYDKPEDKVGYDDLDFQADTQKKIYSLLQTGEYVVALEGGSVGTDVHPQFQGGPRQFEKPVLLGGTWYMLCDKDTTWEDFDGAWCAWDYRFELWYLAKLQKIPEFPDESFLNEIFKNLSHIVCGIYDGFGYLIWYPPV